MQSDISIFCSQVILLSSSTKVTQPNLSFASKPMSLSLTFTLLLTLLGLSLASDPHICLSDLPTRIEASLARLPRSHHALLFRAYDDAGRDTLLFEKNSQHYMTPASNNKILTTSAAYIDMGADFKFRTPLARHPEDSHKYCLTLTGHPELAVEDLRPLIEKAKLDGKGIVLDTETYFGPLSEDVPGTWEIGDLPYYYSAQPVAASIAQTQNTRGVCNTFLIEVAPGAKEGDPMNVSVLQPIGLPDGFWKRAMPVQFERMTAAAGSSSGVEAIPVLGFEGVTIRGALAVGAKSQQLTVTHTNPTHFAHHLLHYLASEQSVTVELGRCYTREAPVVASADSAPSVILMDHTLKTSDNTYTELYLRNLGAKYLDRNSTALTAEKVGLGLVRSILEHYLDISPITYHQVDGSGLSRWNMVSADALVDVITGMYDHYKDYITFFPEAGRSGTLSNRFTQYPGILRAKTGTITSTSSLSGVIYSKHFHHTIFSVIVNQSTSSASEIRAVIDEICIMVAFVDPSC